MHPITTTYQVTDCDNIRRTVFIVFHAEPKSPLTEANIDISGDQVEIFCSSVMDCLVLTYNCSNSEILRTLYIHSNGTKVMGIAANRLYSIAFFGINDSRDSLDQPLERHPGKVMNGVVTYSEESSASAASTSINTVILFCVMYLFS